MEERWRPVYSVVAFTMLMIVLVIVLRYVR